jgi:hypothetical protein
LERGGFGIVWYVFHNYVMMLFVMNMETKPNAPQNQPNDWGRAWDFDSVEGGRFDQEDPNESQRIYSQNYNRIKKQLGEDFAKEVRGNLSEFMLIDGFAEQMRRIVPVKHNSVETLHDNLDYIRANLQDIYSDNEEIEEIP